MNNKKKNKMLSKYDYIFKDEEKYYSKEIFYSEEIFDLENEDFFKLANLKFKGMLGDVKNKKILDVGCGRGDLSLYLAQNGADVIGIDLSKNYIELCKVKKNQLNLKVEFMVMNAQNLDFEDNTFDIIVGFRIIHHLPNIKLFCQECKHLLKKRGYISFIEPLKRNPIVELNRKYFAPKSRTKYEHPLFMKDIFIIQEIFRNIEYSVYFLISPLAMFFNRVFNIPVLFRIFYKILNEIELPLSKINFLKRYYWQIVFKCIKF